MSIVQKIMLSGVLGLALLCTIVGNANAGGRTIWFSVYNAEGIPIRMEIPTNWHNCYQPHREGVIGTIRIIQPGESYGWWVNRVQGHGCDGENGVFKVRLTQIKQAASGEGFQPLKTRDGVPRQEFCLAFSNSLGMWQHPCANNYGATLKKTRYDAYQLSTAGLTKALSAGIEPGRWELICAGVCNSQKIATKSQESQQTSSFTSEEKSAIAMTLSAGVELKGFSASSSMTSSHEKTIGRTMSDSVTRGQSFTDHTSFVFSSGEMNKLNIQAVWQWTVATTTSNGRRYVIRSPYYTCTSGNAAPTYDPLDERAERTCSGRLAVDNVAFGVESVLGSYTHSPYQNAWHKGTISRSGNSLKWTNTAGVSWGLVLDTNAKALVTDPSNPYYKHQHLRSFKLLMSGNKVTGFDFGGTYYKD